MASNVVEISGQEPQQESHTAEHVPYDEKADIKDDAESVNDELESDPFVPFPVDPKAPVEPYDRILTFRAIAVGCILGGLVNASNVYLGTPTGHHPITEFQIKHRF